MTKKYVYSLCVSAAKESREEPLSWCLFHKVWADFCQNVVIQLTRSDLCALCQQNQMTVAKMRNLPEDRKLESKESVFCKKATTDPDVEGVTVEVLKNVV